LAAQDTRQTTENMGTCMGGVGFGRPAFLRTFPSGLGNFDADSDP
jgi:hypothetical protein